jgi:hypothetical protein
VSIRNNSTVQDNTPSPTGTARCRCEPATDDSTYSTNFAGVVALDQFIVQEIAFGAAVSVARRSLNWFRGKMAEHLGVWTIIGFAAERVVNARKVAAAGESTLCANPPRILLSIAFISTGEVPTVRAVRKFSMGGARASKRHRCHGTRYCNYPLFPGHVRPPCCEELGATLLSSQMKRIFDHSFKRRAVWNPG